MKVSQELSISFWLRKYDKSPSSLPAITVRITISGEKDGFSIGYKVDPKKFDHKADQVKKLGDL